MSEVIREMQSESKELSICPTECIATIIPDQDERGTHNTTTVTIEPF